MSAAAKRYPTYKRATMATVLLFFALWIGYVLLVPNANGKAPGTGIPIGAQAPDFELKTIDGKIVRLADFKGQPVMLNFFATWCPPCRTEMPTLQEIYREYESQGFVLLAINLNESNLAVNKFRESYGLTFPIVIDKEDRVSRVYDIVPLPTSYFVDRNGVVQGRWTGELSKEKLRSFVKQISQ